MCVLAGLLFPSPLQARTHRIVVVIGNNVSQDKGLDPLSFADDDAFKYAYFFRFAADEVTLLARADAASAALYSEVLAVPPTRANALAALDANVDLARKLADEGHDVVFYLVYSGHGNYDREGRGYLHLEDGVLTTRDIFYHLIGCSDGFNVVLLVDACNAGFLVRSKGGSDRRPASPTTLELEKYTNVGLILSSSSTGEVKEWGRYLAGIFSHQVRSALSGAADADGNQRITFPELAAFIEAANAQVENPALRLTPYVRPPLARPGMAVVDLSEATFERFLSLSFDQPQRAVIYDQELVRYADFRLEAGFRTRIVLPGDGEFHVTARGAEYLVPAGAKGALELEKLESQPDSSLASRGTDQYFAQNLFSVPYGRTFAADYIGTRYEASLVFSRFEERPWYENEWGWVAVGTGLALAGAGGYFYGVAQDEHDQALATPWASEKDAHNRNIRQYDNLALAAGLASGAALATGVALFILDRPTEEVFIAPSLGDGLSLVPSPAGALVQGQF